MLFSVLCEEMMTADAPLSHNQSRQPEAREKKEPDARGTSGVTAAREDEKQNQKSWILGYLDRDSDSEASSEEVILGHLVCPDKA